MSYEVKKPQYNINSVNSLYLIVSNLVGKVEAIKGSTARYLVVDESNKMVFDVFKKLFKCIADKINKKNMKDDYLFEIVAKDKIIGINKWRFSSDVVLPVDK